MSVEPSARAAGQFAQERFRERRRRWLLRIWWAVPALLVVETAIFAGIGALFFPGHFELLLGIGVGAGGAFSIALIELPPHHIARWRQGAEGEQATAKALRPLLRRGWQVIHDVDTGRGNLDHVLVGPAGVFVLETKNLSGEARVQQGVLAVHRREAPEDDYTMPWLARQMHRRARLVQGQLAAAEVTVASVDPVVVLWCRFEQRSWLSGKVAWVHGKRLASALGARPTVLAEDDVARVGDALRATLQAPRHEAPPPVARAA